MKPWFIKPGTLPDSVIEVVRDEPGLEALTAEWDDLWRRADRPYFSQGFEWCALSWSRLAQHRGRSLFIVVVRQAGKVVLIWPLMSYTLHTFNMLRPLGPEGSEYGVVLCEDNEAMPAVIAEALAYIRRHVRVDVLRLPFVRCERVLGQAVQTFRLPMFSERIKAAWVDWTGVTDWQTYFRNRISDKHRKNYIRLRKLPGETGTLVFDSEKAGPEAGNMLDWIMAHKREWMAQTGNSNAWLTSEDYIAFLKSYLIEQHPDARLETFSLSRDGQPFAAALTAITNTRLELLITAYDNAWSKYSPGQLLLEDITRWAFEHGLEMDLRIGADAYKQAWRNREGSVLSIDFALSFKGALFVCLRHVQNFMRRLRT